MATTGCGQNTITRRLRIVLLILIAVGVGRLVWRVGSDAMHFSVNFRPIFLASVAWGREQNPYAPASIRTVWSEVRGANDQSVAELFDRTTNGVPDFWNDTPPVYPPTSLVVVWPLTVLSWPAARVIWLGLNVLLSGLAWAAAVNLVGLRLTDWRALLLGAIWSQLGPFATCVRLGNPAAHAVALSVLGIWCGWKRRDLCAGALIGLAAALKPQIGGVFIVYFAVTRRFTAAGVSVALLALITAIGAARLAHVPWLESFRGNLQATSMAGATNDPSTANPKRWQMVNLQYPLHTFLDNRMLVTGVAWIFTAAAGLVYLRLLWAAGSDRPEMLVAGIPALLCLLPVYHRYYDALLMVIPLAWAASLLYPAIPGKSARRMAIAVLICSAPFYVSWPWALNQLSVTGRLPQWILNSWWWNGILMLSQCWALLIMLASLMIALAGYASQSGRKSDDSRYTVQQS